MPHDTQPARGAATVTPPMTPRELAWPWLLTMVLVTLNLRPFLTATGPLAPTIARVGGFALETLAWLTLLPMLLMGIGTWLAPGVQRHIGARRTVALGLALLVVGNALRLAPAQLIVSAAVCGLAVALVQGVLPGLIKLHSPHHLALMTGLYSAALMGGGALGAQLSPLALQLGVAWTDALALWALPALAALGLAWWQLAGAHGAATRLAGGSGWLLRRTRSWYLLLAFGLMNGGYAAMVAWLAPHYQALGWSAAQSGSLIAVLSLVQAGAALLLPMLARRWHDRRPWLWLTLAMQAAGFALLAWDPLAAPYATAALLGAGLGACFSFFMLVALDHLENPLAAGALNALMQGGGYLLSALAPWLIARLLRAGFGYGTGWLLQLAIVVLVALMVARFAPRHYARAMRPPG